MILNKRNSLGLAFFLSAVASFSISRPLKAEEICQNLDLKGEQALQFSKIQLWLDHLAAEKGSFSQTDQKGKRLTGKFALQRPDKMRFDYDGKDGIHIVGNEGKIAYTDPSVGQVTFIPMTKTPLGLLFGKTYGWDAICLQKFEEEALNRVSITLTQKKNPSQGNIALRFRLEPLQLSGWRVEDMQGNMTEIFLEKIKSVKDFPAHAFQLPKED